MANISEFPYQLSLQKYGRHTCGASIISKQWAITAAHCTTRSSAASITLRASTQKLGSGGVVHKVAEIIVHESYNPRTIENDISLIKVSTEFKFSNSMKPVGLPSSREDVAIGSSAVVSGWGYTREGGRVSTDLRQVVVPIVSNDDCNVAYYGGIVNSMLCAGFKSGGKDACQGDSGGPLVADSKLIGIVSWGYGCARPGTPGVYTRVASFRTWIKENSGI
ncbi:trypsin-1-like [Anabrus simplex]|uniref:trypsin-1-like n=1 Tax=Anabrus simplex TaxID=316456 RepID=UPI0035A2694E